MKTNINTNNIKTYSKLYLKYDGIISLSEVTKELSNEIENKSFDTSNFIIYDFIDCEDITYNYVDLIRFSIANETNYGLNQRIENIFIINENLLNLCQKCCSMDICRVPTKCFLSKEEAMEYILKF